MLLEPKIETGTPFNQSSRFSSNITVVILLRSRYMITSCY
jgi:hypothetical protein